MGSNGWALVTDHGDLLNRTSLATVRALDAGGYRAAVTVSGDGRSLASASRYCARRVPVPAPSEGDYRAAIDKEVHSGRYVAVLPSSDVALLALEPALRDLVDKSRLAGRAGAAGLSMPPSQTFASEHELRAAAPDLEYPVVVKPTIARFPARRLADARALLSLRLEGWPVLVQPFISGPLRAVGGVMWQGEMVAAVHQRYLRTWPPDCGGASAAETVSPHRETEERLLRLLQSYQGVFMAQFAGAFLLDLNARVYGSLPLAVGGGANLVQVYCDLLRGEPVAPVRARPGVFYRWIEGDIRHAARSIRDRPSRAGPALRSLAPRARAVHSTESLLDPWPMLVRASRLLSDRRRKRRNSG